jgi:sec-independent protein translocase protein TatC
MVWACGQGLVVETLTIRNVSIISKLLSSRAGKKGKQDEASGEKEMSFLDHLEELRWHLIRSFIIIAVFAVVIFTNVQWFLDEVILAPFSSSFPLHRWLCAFDASLCFDKIDVVFIALSPYEQFLKSISISLVAGFVIGFPYFLWEIWRFIRPGLHAHERKGTKGNVLIMSLLFFMGVAFSYYIVTPFSVQFLASYELSPAISNQWKIGNVISMVTQIAIGGGILFEMPIMVYYLSKVGLVTPELMRRYRRHAIVVLLILAAIITPPDWITQVLIFIPLTGLYQVSIYISKVTNRRREKEIAKALGKSEQ